jgi:hypothetical protein
MVSKLKTHPALSALNSPAAFPPNSNKITSFAFTGNANLQQKQALVPQAESFSCKFD